MNMHCTVLYSFCNFSLVFEHVCSFLYVGFCEHLLNLITIQKLVYAVPFIVNLSCIDLCISWCIFHTHCIHFHLFIHPYMNCLTAVYHCLEPAMLDLFLLDHAWLCAWATYVHAAMNFVLAFLLEWWAVSPCIAASHDHAANDSLVHCNILLSCIHEYMLDHTALCILVCCVFDTTCTYTWMPPCSYADPYG